jgi:cation transporter-like permease
MPPDLRDVLLLAIMNPATLAAGFLLGRRADQAQKIVVVGLVAGIAGAAFAWFLMATGLFDPKPRLLGGVFVASGLLGLVWAWIGFATRRNTGS